MHLCASNDVLHVCGIRTATNLIARVYYYKDNEDVENEQCSRNFSLTTRVLTHTYHATFFFTNWMVVIVHAMMILFTVMIGVMWRRVKPQINKNDEQGMANSAEPAKAAVLTLR